MRPDGGKDENVFDIKQGVAITLLREAKAIPRARRVFTTPTFGDRANEVRTLADGDIGRH